MSRNTPLMAAVKRVRKLLLEVEKRAMKNVKLVDGKSRDREKLNKIAEGSQKAREEKIYVKATGMAIHQALKVGQWFREKEKELPVQVEVKTGSVIVVDDIVEKDQGLDKSSTADNATRNEAEYEQMDIDAKRESTTNDGHEKAITPSLSEDQTTIDPSSEVKNGSISKQEEECNTQKSTSRTRRRRKKRPMYSEDEVPEARTRWVKMVEIAISLKG